MKIKICIGKDIQTLIPHGEDDNGNIWYVYGTDISYEHEEYFESIDKAIKYLQQLKEQEESQIRYRCDKCVYLKETCGHTDKDGKCRKYKRDPPDGGYYG